MVIKSFTLAKDPATPQQNEDALVWQGQRLALTDGASSDAFSGLWARRLGEQFVATGTLDQEQAAQLWQDEVRQNPLPWFLADKLRQPTHASFLGLEWDGMQLQVQAIGDSCVFVIRADSLALAFPYDNADHFASHPALVPTQGRVPERRHAHFLLQPDDTLLAATDALAAWILREQAHQPWHSLQALQNETDFVRWVQTLRDSGRLALDDTTLAIIAVGPDTRES